MKKVIIFGWLVAVACTNHMACDLKIFWSLDSSYQVKIHMEIGIIAYYLSILHLYYNLYYKIQNNWKYFPPAYHLPYLIVLTVLLLNQRTRCTGRATHWPRWATAPLPNDSLGRAKHTSLLVVHWLINMQQQFQPFSSSSRKKQRSCVIWSCPSSKQSKTLVHAIARW